MYILRKPDMGLREGMPDIFESVYPTLFLDVLESGKFQGIVKDEATIDALWICIISSAAGA
jgi:hypothetical protein